MILASGLFACRKDVQNEETGTETDAKTEDPGTEPIAEPVIDVPIAENGTVYFRITSAPDLPDEANNAVLSLYQAIKNGAGGAIVMVEDASKIMLSMYGDLLKADFVQLAHHGMKNGYGRNMPNMILFYAKVQPEIILWPNSKEQYYNPQDDELIAVFDWNLEAQKYAKETWLAGGDEITVFELPYTLGSAHAFDPAASS